MRISLTTLLIVIAIYLAGCASPGIGYVTTKYDKFKDSSVELVQIGNTVRLMCIADGSKSYTYAFIIEGVSHGNKAAWPNELVFLLDDDQLRLRGDSNLEDLAVVGYSVVYLERAVFPISGEQIRRIGNASKIEVKLYGRNRSFPGVSWDNQRIEAVNKFHRLFVRREWDRMSAEQQSIEAKTRTDK